MDIKLKTKFNYRITLILLSAIAIFLGAISFVYRAIGIITIPFIAALFSSLMCIERKRASSITVAAILLVAEAYTGLNDYFTLVTLTSILLAFLISYYFEKGKDKAECALFATSLTALLMFIGTALYIVGKFDVSTIPEIVDCFLNIYDKFRMDAISEIYDMAIRAGNSSEVFSIEYLNAFFDAYLDCTIAIICIFAFAIVGMTFKLFSLLVRNYTIEQDKIKAWSFIPSSVFGYFYFILAILSMFTLDTTDALALSAINLYMIFTYVFAYFGYKFIDAIFKRRGKSFTFVFIVMIVALSTFAIQVLAVIGAYVSTNYAGISKKFGIHNDNPKG